MSSPKEQHTVLVALMNNKRDFHLAQEKNWYRIPVASAPEIIKNGTAKLIAFYHTKVFEKEQYTVQWFGRIKDVCIVKRYELFEKEPLTAKSEKEYYKIAFHSLQKLNIPIVSQRPRRILFIPTTEEKFFNAKEVNSLFYGSKLENSFWHKLLANDIHSERQFFITTKSKHFFLDFAVFCKNKKLNIEIDGDQYHMKPENVQYDKRRNNLLESEGWSVLRFTTSDLLQEPIQTLSIIKKTINQYGGIEDLKNPDQYIYLGTDSGQSSLFTT